MEQISMYMSERMVLQGIISEEDKPNYCYSIQLLLEKIVGLSLILVSAAYFHILLQTLAFLVVFITIRRYSDGIHCRTSAGCFCASVLMCHSTSFIAPLLNNNCAMCIGGGGFGYDGIVHNSDSQQPGHESYRSGTPPP